MKAKNIYKKEKEANLKKLMEIAEGKLHENEDIDIEDMGGLVDDVENINIDEEEDKGNKLRKNVKKTSCQFGRAVQGGSFRCYSVTGRGFESLN